jgi:multidrug/hemolysin transport system ATP-binding protein
MTDVIKIDNLFKSYGEVKAVNDLSFKVKKGELFAFLGVNGAGKSTTISVICGTLKKDSGSVIINGKSIEEADKSATKDLGVVFQNSVLDKALSVYDNLECRASLYGIYGEQFKARLKELTDMLDFKDILKRTVGKLSGGQKRKVDIARALIHKPSILILDEPTTGLDPQTRTLLWSVINNLRKDENMTVFLTTHYMEEATDADYVVIIDGGSIVAEGTPLELKNKYTGDFITVYGITDEVAISLGVPYEKISGAYRFAIENTAKATELILKHPDIFVDCEIVKGKMDDVFLSVTGKKLVGGEQK